MKYLLFLLCCIPVLTSFHSPIVFFSGKVVYTYQFKNSSGVDITAAMAKLVGKEQHYFTSEKNYKAYNEKGTLMQLYNSGSNTYYQLNQGKLVQQIDAATGASKTFTLKKLQKTEKIAGYECDAIEIVTDDATTIYYFTSQIQLNPAVYEQHNYGDWSRTLQATNGALPLKFIALNRKMGNITWTTTATSVQAMTFTEEDFQAEQLLR